MKKAIISSFTILTFMISSFLGIFILFTEDTTVSAIIITVDDDGPADYSRIQDAINASNDGDTVYVYNGTYYEHVIVNKTINLTGEGRNNTIIDGGGSGDVVYIVADLVNVSGFYVKGSGDYKFDAGIELLGAQNCSIFSNNVTNNLNKGIFINYSSENNITNNIVSNNAFGIYLESSNDNNISSNHLLQNWAGIFFMRSNSNIITINNASDNNKGIYLVDSNRSTINKNILNFNIEYGLRLHRSNGNIITGNNASNNWAGISVDSSDGNIVTDNNAISNTRDGLWLQHSRFNYIKDNKVFNNVNGIYIVSWGWNNITNNIASNNDIGILSEMSRNDSIINNNASFNNDYGIDIRMSDNNIITSNNISSNNGIGIRMIYSERNNISSNNASFNSLGGIQLRRSDNNTIISNILFSNSGPGIRIYDDSKYNYIITNNVLNNDYGIRVFNLSDGNNITGNTFSFNSGNGIDVWSSTNNNISDNNASDNDGGIKLSLSTWNTIINNTIFSSTWHGILLYGSDRNKVINNNASLNPASGIYLGASNENDVIGNTVSNNERGIFLFLSSDNVIENCSVFSNSYGIRPEEKSYNNIVINSTILNSSSYDFHLSGGSSIIAINTTFNKSKVYFNDETSPLTVKWFMHVYVESTDGLPISGAAIYVTNITDDSVNGSPFTTDDDGFARWIIATEYVQNDTNGGSPGGDNKVYSTPHNVTAILNGITGYAAPEPVMDSSKVINIILDIEKPIADAGMDASVNEDEPYTFDGSGSIDNIGIKNWTWDFGDGSLGYGQNPTHIYTSSGFYVVLLNVTDTSGNWNTDTVNILVNNVPPIADAGNDKVGDEGEQIYFDGSNSIDTTSDIDLLIYTWDFGDGTVSNGKVVNHSYDDNGTYTVMLQVSDDDGATSVDYITVIVNNSAPKINPIAPQVLQEDQSYTLQIIATDVFGDTLTFSDNTTMFDINPVTGVISFIPTNADVGTHIVNVTVVDDDGAESFIEIQINVQNTNDPPIITSSPITIAVENSTYYYNVSVVDDDMDPLTYILDSNPDGMTIDPNGKITWTPTYQQASQTYMVIINVSDGMDFDTQIFSITVMNVNDKPTIISTPNVSANENTHYVYDVNAVDIDIGDWLIYSLDTAPIGMSIDSFTGLITWVPTNDQVGDNYVIVNVTDSANTFVTQEFTLIVAISNDAPVLEAIGPQVATEGVTFSYNVRAVDIDVGDTLTFSDDTDLFDINSNTGNITFVPSNDDVGIYTIKIMVKDSDGAIAFENVLFTVNNVNNIPILPPIDSQTLTEDVSFILVVTATDIDVGDTLIFLDNTTLFDINPYTGEISFTPTNEDVGTYFVNITVKDKSGSITYQTSTFTVSNVNDPPLIEPMGGLTVVVGKAFSYTVMATDVDYRDTLTFSDDTEIFDIDSTTGELSFIPSEKNVGVHYVTITVTDGDGETDQITLTFNILGQKEEEPFDFTWILLLIIVGLVAFLIGHMMKRKEEMGIPDEKEELMEPEEIEMELLEEKPLEEEKEKGLEKEPPPPPPQKEEGMEKEVPQPPSEEEELFEFETIKEEELMGEEDSADFRDEDRSKKDENVQSEVENEDVEDINNPSGKEDRESEE